MAKIRHIALATKDPDKVADFYKAAFDMKEVGRAGPPNPKPGEVYGVYLSDGTLNMAVLNFGNDDQLGKGPDLSLIHISEHPWPGLSAEDSVRAKAKPNVEAAE